MSIWIRSDKPNSFFKWKPWLSFTCTKSFSDRFGPFLCVFNFWSWGYKCHFYLFYLVKLSYIASLNLVSPAGCVAYVWGGVSSLVLFLNSVRRSFLAHSWLNDRCLLNIVVAMLLQCWVNYHRLLVFTSMLYRLSPVYKHIFKIVTNYSA